MNRLSVSILPQQRSRVHEPLEAVGMAILLQDLLKRIKELELSHDELKGKLQLIRGEGRTSDAYYEHDLEESASQGCDAWSISGRLVHNPCYKVLNDLGHALHVYSPGTGEIYYWNRAAESLFGWRDYEAIGKRVTDLLVDEERYSDLEKVGETLDDDESWSGLFPLKKRTGETFTAMVTVSPLYEGGVLRGVVTVSCDAAMFDDDEHSWDQAGSEQAVLDPSPKRPQWLPRPQIAPSVTELASKVFSLSIGGGHGENTEGPERTYGNQNVTSKKEEEVPVSFHAFQAPMAAMSEMHQRSSSYAEQKAHKYWKACPKLTEHSKLGAKVIAKLRIRAGNNSSFQESDGSIQNDA